MRQARKPDVRISLDRDSARIVSLIEAFADAEKRFKSIQNAVGDYECQPQAMFLINI
jgi:hypothetical protein